MYFTKSIIYRIASNSSRATINQLRLDNKMMIILPNDMTVSKMMLFYKSISAIIRGNTANNASLRD